MSKISGVHHINIQITDRQQTQEWYERVLGAQFLDRGPALNKRQLQMRLGNAELHTSVTGQVIPVPSIHFAVEVEDWSAMIAHLDSVGVAHSRTGGGTFTGIGGDDPLEGTREDNGGNYTYINDPDGNLIELVYHTLGMQDSQGKKVELVNDPEAVRWAQKPGFVEDAYKAEPARSS